MFSRILEYGERIPPSQLSHHGRSCCYVAQSWLLVMDRFYYPLNKRLPIWIRRRYEWGPSPWPIYWCEAVESQKLDCGALVALTVECLAARGVKALPGQIVQRFDARTVEQWREAWRRAGSFPDWVAGTYGYHEVCAVKRDESRIDVWDPTVNAFVKQNGGTGYGAAVALRVRGKTDGPEILEWGSHRVPLNRWVSLNGEELPGAQQRPVATRSPNLALAAVPSLESAA